MHPVANNYNSQFCSTQPHSSQECWRYGTNPTSCNECQFAVVRVEVIFSMDVEILQVS